MKKIVVFFVIVLIIICGISYLYLNYKVNYFDTKRANKQFESYLNEEITGNDLATLMNRAIDNNNKNEVKLLNNEIYEDNKSNSISIEIKMTDNNKKYKMETIVNNGIQNFINYYGNIKFKCTDIKYHKNTKKVKYLLFEQIDEK